MEISDPYLRRLVKRWPPPQTRYHTGLMGFECVERELGLTLPLAYKELVHLYGQGLWFETIFVLNPFRALLEGLEPWLDAHRGCGALTWCDRLRAERDEFPSNSHYPIYPETGGIFPWAFFHGIGGGLYWFTEGSPEKWKTLAEPDGPSSLDEWEVFQMSVTELLWRLARGDKRVAKTGVDASIAPYRSTIFEANKGWG
jgi:hypothetical protein